MEKIYRWVESCPIAYLPHHCDTPLPPQENQPGDPFPVPMADEMLAAERVMAGDPIAPTHYTKHAIQPIEFIMQNDLNFAEGCIVKYVSRWRDRGGIEDLNKARAYIDFLIKKHETGSPL